ncbi:MAG: ABC transporter ATP-binding protein [Deltaproteobacteria bacterium]|nr:ABC transporter ATP-binding protein [Deltaproteobacteria bacterium]
MAQPAKLECQYVRMAYDSQPGGEPLIALNGVTLRVAAREFVCLVGPSGCGKTTLLHLIGGLLASTRGRILVDGRVVTGPGPDRAIVFQDPCLFPWRTVLRNISYGLECRGVPPKDAVARGRPLVDLIGLRGFEEHYPYQLSGGMQQRVNLARALAVGPEVLLMDEPFASLDVQTREILQTETLRIWRETEKTILFVTHQLTEAVYLGDRVLVMTARPGEVKDEIVIDLPRPRAPSVKHEPRFRAYEDRIWAALAEEIRRAQFMGDEQGEWRERRG